MAREWNNILYHAAAKRITGSIERICNVHTSTDTTITDHTAGTFVSTTNTAGSTVSIADAPNISHQGPVTGDIVVNFQECIDGPFIAVHVDANPILIYHNGILSIDATG